VAIKTVVEYVEDLAVVPRVGHGGDRGGHRLGVAGQAGRGEKGLTQATHVLVPVVWVHDQSVAECLPGALDEQASIVEDSVVAQDLAGQLRSHMMITVALPRRTRTSLPWAGRESRNVSGERTNGRRWPSSGSAPGAAGMDVSAFVMVAPGMSGCR
jgi:hypothetical protein